MIYPEGCFRKGNRCFENDFGQPGDREGLSAGVKTRSPFEQCAARLNRLRKKAWFWAKLGESIPQG